MTHYAQCHESHANVTICIRNSGNELPEDLTGFGYWHEIPSGQTRRTFPSQRTHMDLQRNLNYTHSHTHLVSSYVFCPNTQRIKPKAKNSQTRSWTRLPVVELTCSDLAETPRINLEAKRRSRSWRFWRNWTQGEARHCYSINLLAPEIFFF